MVGGGSREAATSPGLLSGNLPAEVPQVTSRSSDNSGSRGSPGVRRTPEGQTNLPTNPHPSIEIGHGDVADRLAQLSDPDLVAYLRWSFWEYRHSEKPAFTRWGYSKLFSSARRELVRRGHDRDSWRPGDPPSAGGTGRGGA